MAAFVLAIGSAYDVAQAETPASDHTGSAGPGSGASEIAVDPSKIARGEPVHHGSSTADASRARRSQHLFGRADWMRPAWDLFGFEKQLQVPVVQKEPRRAPFPFLPGEDSDRSASVGTVTDGYLVNGVELPEHPALAILPRQQARGLRYGTSELIATIVEAAESVANRHPDAVLQIGNIGRRFGGDIPYSVSHNSGRDADLAFYARDPDGNPALLPDLLRFDDEGKSVRYDGYYRFDVERNWALVRALVLSSTTQIQYVFVSDGLRALLLDHARASRESPGIVRRAAQLLRQPGPAIPHDDHFHLRVYCSAFDRSAGCVQTGAVHADTELFGQERRRTIARAIELLEAREGHTRADAIRRLLLLEARDAAGERVAALVHDPDEATRMAAIGASIAWDTRRVLESLDTLWAEEPSTRVREHLLGALKRHEVSEATPFLTRLLAEPQPAEELPKPYDLRLLAVDALQHARTLDAIEALIPLLEEPSVELRARAARSLRILSNHDLDGIDWRDRTLDVEAITSALEAWRLWVSTARAQRLTRDEWVRAGFEAAGYTTDGGRAALATSLAGACGDPRDFVRINAQRYLMDWSRNYPQSLRWSRADAAVYWSRWVERHPYRFR